MNQLHAILRARHTLGRAFTLFLSFRESYPGLNKEPAGKAEMWFAVLGTGLELRDNSLIELIDKLKRNQ